MTLKKLDNDVIMLQGVKISYPSLDKPNRFNENDKPKYQASLLVDDEDADKLQSLIDGLIKKDLKGKKPRETMVCLREDDEGAFYLKAKSSSRPYLFDQYAKPVGEQEIEKLFYGGAIVNAKVTIKANTDAQMRSIYAILHAVQFKEDGERLGGGMSEETAAEGFEAAPEAGDDEDW